ncbi:MAG: PAS/PAC sensor signal transduction histidine kinase [Candidatus Moranbacteria bacterium GW2011_GWA2_39_41]|nr:MAG: PAS/PAC sensor signal transduction histidine kinase [Candidatus Moranbacteria bacterium GW2011_GWA2_39_41]
MENKIVEEGCGIIKLEAEVVLDCLEWDILILDRNFKVIFANKAFLDKAGMNKCDAVSSFCYKITHHLNQPCQPPHDTCPLEEMLRTGKPAIETHIHFRKNNDKFLANTVVAPIAGLSSDKFLANTVVAPMKGFSSDIFLHVSMLVKDSNKAKEEMENALNKTMYILDVINTYQRQMDELKAARIDLESKINELEEFNKLAVGREMKMMELKERIKELEKENNA